MADQASQGVLSPFLQRARMKAVRPHLTGRVLDIGCANGALAEHVEASSYCGVDRDTSAVARAKAARPAHRFEGDIPAETFDTIVAAAVIEHLKDPAGALREWASRLADGGRIVLTTPHKLFHEVHEIGAKVGLFSHDAAEEHEIMFDRKSLGETAREAGLEMRVYERFLFGANQLAVLQRTGGRAG